MRVLFVGMTGHTIQVIGRVMMVPHTACYNPHPLTSWHTVIFLLLSIIEQKLFNVSIMKKYYKQFVVFLPACFIYLLQIVSAQVMIKGKVVDQVSRQPIEGVTVILLPGKASGITDQLGNFNFKNSTEPLSISVSSIGYETKVISPDELKNMHYTVTLVTTSVEITAVVVSAHGSDQYKVISKTDIAMRGVNNSQEILRIIPGIVIGQHQGGGKAEQIFLRGFDADHGTDFRLEADGLPINMVSHAHGQGFADSHFLIPETIESVDFKKGPYTASKGDFATTGFVDFNTKKSISTNLLKLEGGQFKTFRGLLMLNLLNKKAIKKNQSWYLASEYNYSDGFFENPQHFNRFNFFTKYTGKIGANNSLMVTATTFSSKWDASGQIPDRAVEKGIIGFYGAVDPTEGGITYRTNFNAQLLSSFGNGAILKNQVYYSRSHFDLHTNFTFFLEDTINGDQIRQKESRNLVGYNGSYSLSHWLGNTGFSTEIGLQVRSDMTKNSELSHTKNRYTLLNPVKLGDITELSLAPYISETIKFNEHFSFNAGLRFDQFYHKYNNKLATDTTLPGTGIYKANANTFSPKLTIFYHINNRLQFYLSTGKGYHSNDTRSVVVVNGNKVLPAAYSGDIGTVFKPAKNIIISAAVWAIKLEQEFVYSGDGGFVEFSDATRRTGFDFSGRYEPVKSLYLDIDVNYARGRAIGELKGANYIPLAPNWTSSAGITYTSKKGLNGSIRYRYVADRPANEDYSRTAQGYFITDLVVNYTKSRYEIGLVINNVLNRKWKETQFDTETRLKNEPAAVSEVCFTPGTPFAAKLSFSYTF